MAIGIEFEQSLCKRASIGTGWLESLDIFVIVSLFICLSFPYSMEHGRKNDECGEQFVRGRFEERKNKA